MGAEQRQAQRLASLSPPDDNPSQIQATRHYLTDARQLLESSERAQDFYDGMLARHPDRLNPGALWGAAITLFPEREAAKFS